MDGLRKHEDEKVESGFSRGRNPRLSDSPDVSAFSPEEVQPKGAKRFTRLEMLDNRSEIRKAGGNLARVVLPILLEAVFVGVRFVHRPVLCGFVTHGRGF